MKKTYISANQLTRDAYALAIQAIRAGYRPDLLVGIWRGGAPVAIAMHEAYDFIGLSCRHLVIRSASYTGIGQRAALRIEGLEQLQAMLEPGMRILLVDDVFDSGNTMAGIVGELQQRCHEQLPELRIAVPYYKPGQNSTALVPDFYLHETEDWLVFPHELSDLDNQELLAKPGLNELGEQLIELRDRHAEKN